MGIFNKFFGDKSNQEEKKQEQQEMDSNIKWIPLTSLEQLEEIKEKSKTKTVGVFKHSTRCSISKGVIKSFDRSFPEELSEKIDIYYLDLLNYREISNEVGHTFQVIHQSPQLVLIKNGVAVADASHYDITQVDLKKITA